MLSSTHNSSFVEQMQVKSAARAAAVLSIARNLFGGSLDLITTACAGDACHQLSRMNSGRLTAISITVAEVREMTRSVSGRVPNATS